MAIQVGAFPLVFDADDFVRTDRGIKWGIKFHRIPGMVDCVYFVQEVNGVKSNELAERDFDEAMGIYGGNVQRWLKEKLIPALNAWLATVFKPGAVVTPNNPYEAAFAAVKGIKITQNADGTLTASV